MEKEINLHELDKKKSVKEELKSYESPKLFEMGNMKRVTLGKPGSQMDIDALSPPQP